MNSARKTSLLSITLSAVLLSGLIAPSLPQAFAGNIVPCFDDNGVAAQDDICIPFYAQGTNSVFRHWSDEGILTDSTPTCDETTGNLVVDQTFPWSADTSNFDLWPIEADFSVENDRFAFGIPNLIDELPFKDMRIQITYCQIASSPSTSPPNIQNVLATEDEDNNPNTPGDTETDTCGFVGFGTSPTGADTTDASYFFNDYLCSPNPDFEEFDVVFDQSEWRLIQVVVDTRTYGEAVGGIFEGVNTAALLVAGAQANALWLIPLITAIGIGIVIFKRKF